MAFEDIIYKSVQEEKLWKDISGKEIKYITDYMPNQHLLGNGLQTVAPTKEAKRSVCQLQWKLYSAYLRNDHTLVSIFQRTAGTNFSLNQRLGCFFMYLCNIMVVTGTFYGLEQSTPAQDVLASFIISLCGTLPVLIIRKFFEKSKPLEVKSTKHVLEDTNGEVEDIDNYAGVDAQSPATPGDEAGEGTLTTMVSARASVAWNDWDMGEFMQRSDLTIRTFNAQITTLYDQENQEHKIRAISDIRKALFDKMFPLSHTFKTVGWIVLILWSLAACVTAIVYGFKFDIEARAIENTENSNHVLYQNNDCWNTTLALRIEADLSKEKFLNDYVEQEVKNASSYAGGDAKSWLLSIFQSLLTSLILWQPLTLYIVTWIKIWMFSWHLKMQVGPGNVVLLCKRCCCGYEHPLDEEADTNPQGQRSELQMLSQYLSGSNKSKPAERRSSRKIRDVIAHKNRPVDIISFLGNEEWIIDDTTNNNASSIKKIHEASDSASLSIKNVNVVDSDQDGEIVELQAITQIKTFSGSGDRTNAVKGKKDEDKEVLSNDHLPKVASLDFNEDEMNDILEDMDEILQDIDAEEEVESDDDEEDEEVP
eukprot:590697_1